MDFSALLDKMLIFLVLMVIGYVLVRRGSLNRDSVKAISALTMNVLLTGSILNSVFSTRLELDWAKLGEVFLILWLMQILGYVIAWFFA